MSQQFLQVAHELAVEADRMNINGFQVKKRLNLELEDYMSIVDGLEGAGYIVAPGGMAKDILLTDAGVRRVKRTGI
jgi:hypothetical protein